MIRCKVSCAQSELNIAHIFMGDVNRALNYLHWGSLQITLTVPLSISLIYFQTHENSQQSQKQGPNKNQEQQKRNIFSTSWTGVQEKWCNFFNTVQILLTQDWSDYTKSIMKWGLTIRNLYLLLLWIFFLNFIPSTLYEVMHLPT